MRLTKAWCPVVIPGGNPWRGGRLGGNERGRGERQIGKEVDREAEKLICGSKNEEDA